MATWADSGIARGDVSWVHEAWSLEDGLPVLALTDLLQSADGYLWIATFNGLARFDGVRFTVFDTGNSDGLPSNRIISLVEGHDGMLWLLTEQGHLVRFDGRAFRAVAGDGGEAFHALHVDSGGTIWVGGNEGLYRVPDDGDARIESAGVGGAVTAITGEGSGALWVGRADGSVSRLRDGETTTWPRGPSRVSTLFADRDGSLWIAHEAGGRRIVDGEWGTLDLGLDEHHATRGFHRTRDGELWVATSLGFFRWVDGHAEPLHPGRDAATYHDAFAAGPGGETWFATRNALYCGGRRVFDAPRPINAFAFDHEGSVWIATESAGLHRLKPGLVEVIGHAEGLAGDIVYPVVEDHDGAVWAGTRASGLSRIAAGEITNYSERDGLNRALVRSLHVDRDGALWVGFGGDEFGGGVCVMKDGRCTPFGADTPLRSASVLAIHRDRTGAVWFGTANDGLFRHDVDGWRHWTVADGLPHDSARVFLEASDGSLWIGTNGGGLARVREDRFESLTTADGLSSNLIRAIHEDDRGALWVGTEGRGLNRVRFLGETVDVTHVRARDGLFAEVIHQVLDDGRGRLWMSSNQGLFWVELEELRAFADGEIDRVRSRGYTERDGLRSREANGGMQPAGIRTRDDRLWFPTQAGIAIVDPERLRRNERPPPVVVESVVTDRTTVPVRRDEEITIRPSGRDLEIRYTALSLLEPDNVEMRYRLDGYDDDWVEAGSRRVAYYTNVPPGRYTFRVIAANNDGVWNLDGSSIAVFVAPRWFEQVWFRPSLVLVALVGVAWVVRRRVRNLEHRRVELESLVEHRTRDLSRERDASDRARRVVETQARRLRELDETKSRFFADVSHEFRTPLTLTIGPLQDLHDGLHGELSEKARHDVDLALRNSRRLLGFINEILEIARLESGELEPHLRPVDLGEVLRDRCQAFVGLAERSRVGLSVDSPEIPVAIEADPVLVERILDNLLSNAFRHTEPNGTVGASLEAREDGRAIVTVRDNGVGISAAARPHIFERFYRGSEGEPAGAARTGIGLALSKELVELHHGTIEVESDEGVGTTFVVTFPSVPTEALESAEPSSTGDASGTARPEARRDPGTTPAEARASGPPEIAAGESTRELDDDDPDADEDVAKVLVVDDNADLRAYLRGRLAPHFRVLEAPDGAAGIEIARREMPDVIVSDVMMPRMDGRALCRAVREDPELECIPVVLLTAKAESADRVESLALGADDYLTKPFDASELLARLDNLIASRRRLRDRLRHEAALRPRESTARSADDRLLERIRDAVETHLGDTSFGVPELAAEVGMSRGHLHRRLRDTLGSSPSATIRSIRLDRAAQLLRDRSGSVSEIAYATGFQSVSHFCRCFKQRFDETPSAYRDREPAGD